ncbi:rhamnan synthesis F family protein, partial [Stenotrophomonas sp. GbtcB23]|uniref:rhamnan synthesis F family protein n=1 Tax=Stenotrophomonas sp. GbtcB23 TaxID=2824768 RepID=UPI00267385F4
GLAGEVMAFANQGRDVLPFLHVANRLLEEGEDVVLKLHTKRSTHMQHGAQWRQELLRQLLGDGHGAQAVARFAQDRQLGLLAPAGHLLPVREYVGANNATLQRLQVRLGLQKDILGAQFSAGSMFWVRLAALRPLLDAHLPPSAFETEQGQIDGTLAHALERTLGAVCLEAGFTVVTSGTASSDSTYAYAKRG